MTEPRHIVMIAAENGALDGAKVGGIGDVLRELPPALAKLNCLVTVITPSYGVLHKRHQAELQSSFEVPFGGRLETVELYRVELNTTHNGRVRHWVLEHPQLTGEVPGRIYNDDAHEPFATDATRFALFGAAAAEILIHDPDSMPDAVHLHDWHAAAVLLLRQFSPRHRALRALRCVYSIHNLGLQGIRPLQDNPSSLQAWFPELQIDERVADPRWPECYNPVRLAVDTASMVHAVSPTYAAEIQRPNAVEARGYHGGEGLERSLQAAAAEGRLVGILNGCHYPTEAEKKRDANTIHSWSAFLDAAESALLVAAAEHEQLRSCHFIAARRIARLRERQPSRLLTSVSRVSEQKVGLLLQQDSLGTEALKGILSALGNDGLYVFLGNGQRELEHQLTQAMAHNHNFLFLNCYSEALAQALYQHGDLFMMPSSYEPCGLSQMLAMRAGQPCLVHAVGGLVDTVKHGKSGLVFDGATLTEKADQLVLSTRGALQMQRLKQRDWKQLEHGAAKARFLWSDSAQQYLSKLYDLPIPLPTAPGKTPRPA